jgi:CheY-like chemotaxis protein
MSTTHRVLVVEDDELIRESLVDYLADQGYQAVGAENGQDALEKLEANDPPPCLIVLDLMMPVMDGPTFREEQLRNPRLSDIPVVVISAYRDVKVEAKTMKASSCLSKPLKLADLLRVVRQHCSAA